MPIGETTELVLKRLTFFWPHTPPNTILTLQGTHVALRYLLLLRFLARDYGGALQLSDVRFGRICPLGFLRLGSPKNSQIANDSMDVH